MTSGDDFHTEHVIAFVVSGLGHEAGERVRSWAEQVDPRGQRNAAIRAVAGLLAQSSVSATAKAIESELGAYLTRTWPRERDLASPAPAASALRQNLWRIAKLTDGDGLGWRRILDIIEIVE